MTQPPLFSLAIIAAVTVVVYVIPDYAGVAAERKVVQAAPAPYHPDNEREILAYLYGDGK